MTYINRSVVSSVGSNVAALRIASNFSIFSKRSIFPSDKISSISCIDSVKLAGSEDRGDTTPLRIIVYGKLLVKKSRYNLFLPGRELSEV